MGRKYATELSPEHYTLDFDHEFLFAMRGMQLSPEIEELWSVGTIQAWRCKQRLYLGRCKPSDGPAGYS